MKATAISLAIAERLAAQVVDLLRPACTRIEVAGSIRRRKPSPGDIEIVCIAREIPGPPSGLFDDPKPVSALDGLVDRLLAERVLAHRPDVNGRPSCGSWAKRLLFDGFPLDVFRATPETWGVAMAIRTGPADFSRKLATPKSQGGVLPPGIRLHAWRYWRGDVALDTPEEADVFHALGLPNWHPERRK